MNTTKCPHCAGELSDDFIIDTFVLRARECNVGLTITDADYPPVAGCKVDLSTFTFSEEENAYLNSDFSIHEGKP